MNKKQARKLFKKYNNNECSAEELKVLEHFLDSYQNDNQEWPESVFGKEADFKKSLWRKIESEIKKDVKKKRYPFKPYLKYAIAASVVLLVSIGFFMNKEVFSTEPQNNNQIIVENEILSGTDKATLTLEDGTTVALEKGKPYATNHLNSDGEALVYESDEKDTEPEIEYNYLTIPRGGQFFVQLSDGTKVWLNSESQLKYPVKFINGKPREIELVYGEAYFDVSPSTEHNGAIFSVQSKGQNIEVLGTEFNINAYRDEAISYTTLVEGKIALSTESSKEILQPGQQAVINADQGSLKIQLVDVYNVTSWKNGIFSFKGKTLKEITKVLSRWYDIDFNFNNKALEDVKFIGVLSKKQPLEGILETIKSTEVINSYKIQNGEIIIN